MFDIMEQGIVDFDFAVNEYETLKREITALEIDIEDAEYEIRIAQLDLQYETEYKTRCEKKLFNTKQKLLELLDSWNGTILKEDSEEADECVIRTKVKHKAQIPCSNHTYKDLRHLTPKARCAKKRNKQHEIKMIERKHYEGDI